MINLYLVYCIYKFDIMKKLLLLLIGLTVISCSGSDDDVEDNPIVGDWSTEITYNTVAMSGLPAERNEYFYFFSFKSDGTVIQENSYIFIEIQSNGTESISLSGRDSRDGSWTYLSGEGQNQTYSIIGLGNSPCDAEIRFLPDMSSLTSMNDCSLPMTVTLDRR